MGVESGEGAGFLEKGKITLNLQRIIKLGRRYFRNFYLISYWVLCSYTPFVSPFFIFNPFIFLCCTKRDFSRDFPATARTHSHSLPCWNLGRYGAIVYQRVSDYQTPRRRARSFFILHPWPFTKRRLKREAILYVSVPRLDLKWLLSNFLRGLLWFQVSSSRTPRALR